MKRRSEKSAKHGAGRKESTYRKKQRLLEAGQPSQFVHPAEGVRPPKDGEYDVDGEVVTVVMPTHLFVMTPGGDRVYVDAEVAGDLQFRRKGDRLRCRARLNRDGLRAFMMLPLHEVAR